MRESPKDRIIKQEGLAYFSLFKLVPKPYQDPMGNRDDEHF